MTDVLKSLRDQIDMLDQQIQEAISKRAELAQQVAHAKRVEDSNVFYRPEREADVLRRIMERNAGPLSDEEMARVFREIMSVCLALEQVMTIAYLGPEGTFTQAAAHKHFGHSVKTLALATIDNVFREVESGTAHYGVVPVENSTEGVINHTLDLFMNSSLKICGEVELRIHHHLLSKCNDLKAVQKVYSHRQSFAQCREWLVTHLVDVEQVDVSSNAEAARLASQQANTAAIAGESAAEIYGMKIITTNIEDEPDNTTRFLIIGKQETPPSLSDKTTMLVSSRNKPGALHSLLKPFARNNISMTRIESRPSRRGIWEYVFFIDIEGHKDNQNIAKSIKELEQEASLVKILGSYPRAVL